MTPAIMRPTNEGQVFRWVKACLGFQLHATCRCVPKSDKEALEWAREGKEVHQSQLQYVTDGHLNRYSACVLMACRGAGKSYATAALCILDCYYKPGLKVAVAAFVRQQSDYIYEYISSFLAHFKGVLGRVEWSITKDEITFTNGATVKFFSGGKSQANVTGYHPHVLIVDEADKFTSDQFDGISNGLEGGKQYPSRFDVLSTNYSLSGDGVILKQIERYTAFNKTKPDSLLPRNVYRVCLIDILERCGDEFKCYDEVKGVHCPLWRYCKGRAKEQAGFYGVGEAIGKMLNSSLPTFESQMLLLRPSSEFAIFDGFSVAAHVPEQDIQFDPTRETFLCFDFGGVRCPHAAVLMQRVKPVMKERRPDAVTYFVIDEFEGMGLLENMIEQIRAKYPEACRVAQVMADPAGNRKEQTKGATSYIGVLKKAGFAPTNRPIKRKPSFEMMKSLISPASGPPLFYVNKRCRTLIKQIQAAEYESRGGKPTGEPADNGDDDVLDCARMVVGSTWGTAAKHSGKPFRFF